MKFVGDEGFEGNPGKLGFVFVQHVITYNDKIGVRAADPNGFDLERSGGQRERRFYRYKL